MTGDQHPLNSPQKLHERINLDFAIKAAGLGAWEYNITTGIVNWDEICRSLYGVTEGTQMAYEQFMQCVHPDDTSRMSEAIQQAGTPQSGGYYDITYRVFGASDGIMRWVHCYGKAEFTETGEVSFFGGVLQDVTQQQIDRQQLEERTNELAKSEERYRLLAAHLEEQVQRRTEELAASNEELAAINEELASSNEEYAAVNEELSATNEGFTDANQTLEQANQDLIRSNQNLEQFAYIASHDLQEPLRKIQQFGDLLQGQYGDVLGEGVSYLQRMQVAASRMSILIKDLLTFSRIATTQVAAAPVPLHEVVNQVLESLSVAVEESEAQIRIGDLPTVQGDMQQLTQLFQNLLSNALKFRRTATEGHLIPPQIAVRSHQLAKQELPTWVKPTRDAKQYDLIEVIDNGIGFDEKYVDRIFQVFQRLHGKNEFAGTGVGLAIVQKVVTNHGGAITASSAVNQGATFRVYLPAQ